MTTFEDESEPHWVGAVVKRRGDKWVVIYASAIVGRHDAKFKAIEQARNLNGSYPARYVPQGRSAPR